MNVYEILSRDNYLVVNKILLKQIGITETILLSELCYRRQYLARMDKLTADGYFYATVEDIQEETSLNEYQQRNALEHLRELNIVSFERRGMPSKRYITIHEEALIELLSSPLNFKGQVPKNLKDKSSKNSVLNNNNNINNNKSNISKDILDTPHKPKGKLLSSKTNTRQNNIRKINNFITNCQKIARKKVFTIEVTTVLDSYFIMLAESNALLPMTTIESQLTMLKTLSPDKQVEAVEGTVSHGWKSLQYEIDRLKTGKVPSWDTADANAFQAKTEEEKRRNLFEGVPEEEIF